MNQCPGHILGSTLLAEQAITEPVLSVVLTVIGLTLLVGLAITYAVRRRDAAPPVDNQRKALENLLADAEELAGRLAANLDAKAARMERLIAQADDRLARLERQQAEAAFRPDRRHAEHAPPDDTGPLNSRIYDLADRGLPPVEIARRLSQQVGQVELILALRRG